MHVEPELEAFLRRLVPGCEAHWVGASEDEINEIEDFAERPLPPFYRWFLATMGRSMGPLADPRQDLSVTAVLSKYRAGFEAPSPFLLIAIEPDEIMPMEVYYDLERPCRDDALVCSVPADGSRLQIEYETLRESIARGCFIRLKSMAFSHRCRGSLNDEGREVLAKLAPVASWLGLHEPIPTGPFCGIYAREDLAVNCMVSPRGGEKKPYVFFEAAANSEATIRSFLGTVATETSIEIQIDEWR